MSHMKHSDPDRFDWRRPADYGWVLLGLMYYLFLPIIWIVQLMGSVDTSTSSRRTRSPRRLIRNTVSTTPRRFRMPRTRAQPTPRRTPPEKPIISTTSRWVKSLGRYQSRHYNRNTRRTTVSPRVSDLTPKR